MSCVKRWRWYGIRSLCDLYHRRTWKSSYQRVIDSITCACFWSSVSMSRLMSNKTKSILLSSIYNIMPIITRTRLDLSGVFSTWAGQWTSIKLGIRYWTVAFRPARESLCCRINSNHFQCDCSNGITVSFIDPYLVDRTFLWRCSVLLKGFEGNHTSTTNTLVDLTYIFRVTSTEFSQIVQTQSHSIPFISSADDAEWKL